MSASNPTIEAFLFSQGISPNSVFLPDSEYALPAADWISSEFHPAWIAFRDSMLGMYEAEDTDCDDFALGASFFAKYLHRKTKGRPPGTALAFGEFWYTPAAGGGHAINLAVCRDQATNLFLVFYEPQLAQTIRLSQTEIQSCGFCRF